MKKAQEILQLSLDQCELAIIILQDLAKAKGAFDFIRYEKSLKQLKDKTGAILELKDVKTIMLRLEVLSFVEEHCCNSSYLIRDKGIDFLKNYA